MASRWDGKVGKIPKIGEKRESKRFSPRLTGVEPEFHECRLLQEDYQRSDNGTLRSPGAAELYTPETVGQYKSQWARYQRALTLNPASIIQQGKKVLYKFESCDSITGFWEVEVSSGATYLNIKKRIWQILCPKIIDFDVIDSDGETFTWTQTRGKRTATLDGIVLSKQDSQPFDTTIPKIDILTLCLNNGCADNSPDPIVLNVQPEEQPELFDSVIIYTTPTSSLYDISYNNHAAAADVIPCRSVPYNISYNLPPIPPLPAVTGAYIYEAGNLPVSWNNPTCDTEFLVETVWQQNTTGQYLDVARFPVNNERKFVPQLNTHYRILSVFNTHGRISKNFSSTFYFTHGIDKGKAIAADEIVQGISYSLIKSNTTYIPLARQSLDAIDNFSGISTTKCAVSFNTLPLNALRLESIVDACKNISFASIKTTVQKFNLGGMIIQ